MDQICNAIAFEDPTDSRSDGAKGPIAIHIGVLVLKPVRTPVAIFGSVGVCIYVSASRHWLISYSLIHLT